MRRVLRFAGRVQMNAVRVEQVSERRSASSEPDVYVEERRNESARDVAGDRVEDDAIRFVGATVRLEVEQQRRVVRNEHGRCADLFPYARADAPLVQAKLRFGRTRLSSLNDMAVVVAELDENEVRTMSGNVPVEPFETLTRRVPTNTGVQTLNGASLNAQSRFE